MTDLIKTFVLDLLKLLYVIYVMINTRLFCLLSLLFVFCRLYLLGMFIKDSCLPMVIQISGENYIVCFMYRFDEQN
jgi:hypothetical protein